MNGIEANAEKETRDVEGGGEDHAERRHERASGLVSRRTGRDETLIGREEEERAIRAAVKRASKTRGGFMLINGQEIYYRYVLEAFRLDPK